MFTDQHQKVTTAHLERDAFVYVRQSSLRQVFENTESTKRQYALRDRAVALGWPMERIHVIDSDLGLSGASAQARDGFQHLMSELANGHAGFNTRASNSTNRLYSARIRLSFCSWVSVESSGS